MKIIEIIGIPQKGSYRTKRSFGYFTEATVDSASSWLKDIWGEIYELQTEGVPANRLFDKDGEEYAVKVTDQTKWLVDQLVKAKLQYMNEKIGIGNCPYALFPNIPNAPDTCDDCGPACKERFFTAAGKMLRKEIEDALDREVIVYPKSQKSIYDPAGEK